ncbi:MAG: hypothetical protein LBM28_03125 [Oscillospiraceae bacterium]|jgi:YbbR domain-containing protein|nr:hypothetical protein [Oscillospiraceae bacterium]
MHKHKILAFLLALVISVALWVYAVTVVNPDDTVTISGISLQLEGADVLRAQGLMITGGENIKVSVTLSGRRSDLRELNSETVAAVADVTRISSGGSHQLSWSIVLPSSVATGDIKEVNRTPSRITVSVSEIQENPEVPVEIEYSGEPQENFMIDKSNVVKSVDVLSISGPAAEVENIDHAIIRVDVSGANALIDNEYTYALVDTAGNELPIGQYVTVSSETVRVTIPVLRYKDISLTIDIIPGGGATLEDVRYEILPKTIRVTGSEADLAAMPDEMVVKTVELSEMGYEQELLVHPQLPGGVTNSAQDDTVTISLRLLGLITKEFAIDVSQIQRLNDDEEMLFGTQTVRIVVRGKPSVVNALTEDDFTITADMVNGYDASAKTVTLVITLPKGTSAGVIGTPYTLQVIQ